MSTYTNVAYHTLDAPLNPKQLPAKYSDLHTLYPGRPMDSDDNFNRYSIEPENPEAAKKMFQGVKEKTAEYGASLEQQARRMNGDEKMTVHAVEDPSMIVEDPDLKDTNMLNPDGTPLLIPVNPRLPDRMTGPEGELRKPLVENYNGPDSQTKKNPNQNIWSYKWLLLVLIAVGLFFLTYLYSTRQIDIYEF